MTSVILRSTFLAFTLALVLFTSPTLAQDDPGLSVHATADSLTVTIGSDIIVVPRDVLALLASPEGYTQDALSAHIALLHGTLTIEDGEPSDDAPPPADPTIPLLTNSAPLALGIGAAERTPGSQGDAWVDVTLEGNAVVQMLPDVGTIYGHSGGPRLNWGVEVAEAGSYFLYVYGAGIRAGHNMWVGTPGQVKRASFGKHRQLEWASRVGPFSLNDGPGTIQVRGRMDGAYVAAVVVSANPNLTESDLDAALGDAGFGAGAGSTAYGETSDITSERGSAGGTPIPAEFALHPVYPNPTLGATTARFDLPEPAEVRVEVFNTLGRRVEEQRASLEAGFGHTLSIGTASLASGVYLVRVTARSSAGDTVGVRRLTVLR